jgi:hypothetical protein
MKIQKTKKLYKQNIRWKSEVTYILHIAFIIIIKSKKIFIIGR